MICTLCKKPVELSQGNFIPKGMIPHTTIKRQDFVCHKCVNAIDNTSREPGSDDET